MVFEYLEFSENQGVALITLNRPAKFNSFVRAMALELQEALDYCNREKHIRCVLLTGNGKAFCAGQDLSEAIDPNGVGITRIVEEHYNPVVTKIRFLTKPVICAVNGVAAGAGANIALSCDITFAAKSSSFIQAFSKIGLIPDSGGTYILPRLIGMQRASALMFSGEKVGAEEAEKMGMIYKSVPDEKLHEEALGMALKLATMPTKAIEYTKSLLNVSMQNGFEKQLSEEGKYQSISANTHDYKEGVAAFLEKRNPVFKGE
jgi:2-(1,2-epoxy-1,2-dihydrophenyl)acetyl-CoA isomerase